MYDFLLSIQNLLHDVRPVFEHEGTMFPSERIALGRTMLDKVNILTSSVNCLVDYYTDKDKETAA